MTTVLAGQSVLAGDLVLVAVEDPARFAEIFLALVANGIGAVIANPRMAEREFRGILDNTQPAGLIVDRSLLSRFSLSGGERDARVLLIVNQAVPGGLLGRLLGGQAVDGDAFGYPDLLNNFARTSPADPNDPALPGVVVNTSGTTSDPKNVLISRGAMKFHLDCLVEKYGVTADSTLLNVIPLHHIDGAAMGPLLAYYSGATWARPCEFSHQNLPTILDAVYGRRVTHFIAVPALLSLVMRLGDEYRDCFDSTEFQMLISTAGMLPARLWREFEEAFGVGIANEYSLSECNTGLYSGLNEGQRRVGSIGKPHGAEIRIVGEQENDAAPGETGELWLKSGSMMDGYINNPEATAACLEDGWLRTGDLVRQDADGFVFIVGRIKEMISFAGHTVAPSELVEALMMHPEVSAATVAGLSSEEWGEIPIAFVVREEDSEVDAGALLEHCRLHLSEYKVPRELVFVEELARTPTGKVMNAAMVARHLEQNAIESGDVDHQVLAIAQACFRTASPPGPGASPATEPGWDSLAHMDLLLRIEKAFDIRFSAREIMMLEDMGSVIDLVRQKCPE